MGVVLISCWMTLDFNFRWICEFTSKIEINRSLLWRSQCLNFFLSFTKEKIYGCPPFRYVWAPHEKGMGKKSFMISGTQHSKQYHEGKKENFNGKKKKKSFVYKKAATIPAISSPFKSVEVISFPFIFPSSFHRCKSRHYLWFSSI